MDGQSIIVTSYLDPDLDGVSCLFGYAELLQKQHQKAHAYLTGTAFSEAQWVLDQLQLTIPQMPAITNEKIILVDTSNPDDIDPRIPVESVIEVVDHRAFHSAHRFAHAKTQIELIGAAATLIAEKFAAAHIKPSKESATLLYGGIVSNTMNFQAATTSERDRTMAQWLVQEASIASDFGHRMLLAKSDLTGKSMKTVIESDIPAPKKVGSKTIIVGQLEIIGARKLYETRYTEIQEALRSIKNEQGIDIMFLSTVDLEEGKNYFCYINEEDKHLLQTVLGAHEQKNYLVRDTMITRKEILPILNTHFSKV